MALHYRLAPEHRFPAAIEDAVAGARWLAENVRRLGGLEGPVGVAGDSAGGNLAATVARSLTREGVPVAFQLLVYPMLDATASSRSYEAFASGYGFSREKSQWYFDQYLPPEVDRRAARLAPVRAGPHGLATDADRDRRMRSAPRRGGDLCRQPPTGGSRRRAAPLQRNDPRRVAAVEAGRADYLPQVPPRLQAQLIARYGPGSPGASSGRQRYFSGPSPTVQGYLFNPRRPLFARTEMRRAVNYAIDRRALAQHPIPAMLAGRPTDQHIPPGWPGFRDAAIYPLGAPDLAAARRLAGDGRHHGVLYTCNQPECLEQAEIVRENLAAIGIDLEIRRFAYGTMFARVQNPDEPFDLSLTGWISDTPDPAESVDVMFRLNARPSTRFLYRTPLGRPMRAAEQLTGAPRLEAYAALDRDLAAQAAPFAEAMSGERTDFFSARIGCQVEHPLYGIDLGALCVRN